MCLFVYPCKDFVFSQIHVVSFHKPTCKLPFFHFKLFHMLPNLLFLWNGWIVRCFYFSMGGPFFSFFFPQPPFPFQWVNNFQFSILLLPTSFGKDNCFWFYNLSFILNFFPLPTTFSYGTCDLFILFFSTFQVLWKGEILFMLPTFLSFRMGGCFFSHCTFLCLFSPFRACPFVILSLFNTSNVQRYFFPYPHP